MTNLIIRPEKTEDFYNTELMKLQCLVRLQLNRLWRETILEAR